MVLRPGSGAVRTPLGVATVAGRLRLHLCFRYRHSLFGPDAAGRFAERYLAELDRLLTKRRGGCGG